MPEIPDIEAYIEALRSRVLGSRLLGVRLACPFLLRTVEPPLSANAAGTVLAIGRMGKRIELEVAGGSEPQPTPEPRRASGSQLASEDPKGAGLAAALRRENHTLKRALTDPHILSGIGNAYSDEILHQAAISVLREWTQRLCAEARSAFPEKKGHRLSRRDGRARPSRVCLPGL